MYGLIAFEVIHRTLAAFLGAAVLLFITHTLGTYDEAYKGPDLRTGDSRS